MIQRSIKRLSMRALVVDDELTSPDRRRPGGAGAGAGAAGPRRRGRGGRVRRRRQLGDRLRLRHPRGAGGLDPGRRTTARPARWRSRPRAQPDQAGPVPERQDPHLPDGRAGRGVVDSRRRHGDGGRVHLDPGGHGGLRRRPRGRGDPAVRGRDAAAPGGGAHEVQPGVRVFLAHARPHRRHRVSQVARGADLLRLLRGEPAPLRPLDQRRRAGLAARPHRPDRRAREVRGPGLRRPPHLLRHQRHVHVEPGHLHGRGGAGPDRALRPELPQVDRAQPGHVGRDPASTWCRCATATGSSAPSRRIGSSRPRSRPPSRRTRW